MTNDYQGTPALLHDLVTVGDASIELRSAASSLTEALQFDRIIAGSAAQIAIFNSMLGGRSACIACVGADALGTCVQNELRKSRVDVSGLQYSHEYPTSLIFTARAGRLLQTTHYRLADWQLHVTKEHVALAQGSRIVHASGFTLWKHPARHSIFELLRLSKKVKALTVLQPYYEPALWRDRNDAIATLTKTLQFADLATPTVDDAEHLFGKIPREDSVRRFHDLGAGKVILTMGKDGCLVSDGRSVTRVPAVESRVIDPSGVISAWHAGLFYAINAGKELASAAFFANAVGGYVLQTPGALVVLPSADTIAGQTAGVTFEAI
jgi:sugar/nucleoside kinase (ribokinase family)